MKTEIYVFYQDNYDPLTIFNIRNADLRNPQNVVNYRCYITENNWASFVDAFITSNSGCLADNSIFIDRDFKGFILMYYDSITEKRVIVTDPKLIIEALSQ